jgi:hypothetical protein
MNDLRDNLLHALRMFRHGASFQEAGQEFLAKFSALECLVCGSERHGRKALLQSRLTELFDDDMIISTVLPDDRSEADTIAWSHEKAKVTRGYEQGTST